LICGLIDLKGLPGTRDPGCSPGLRGETTGKVHEKRMSARLMILNGPNLNLLGVREPYIYGSTTLDAVKACCEAFARFAGAKLAFHQSNHDGVLVDHIQAARRDSSRRLSTPAAPASFTAFPLTDASDSLRSSPDTSRRRSISRKRSGSVKQRAHFLAVVGAARHDLSRERAMRRSEKSPSTAKSSTL
jgi:hypothetical protein